MSLIVPPETNLVSRTLFGKGSSLKCADCCLRFGSHGVVVHSASIKQSPHFGRFIAQFHGAKVIAIPHSGEPAISCVDELLAVVRNHQARWIVGIGGGSTLDLAKAAAGLFHAAKPPDYYQAGGALETEGIPFVAVPTTAGAGSEATPNAVITNPARKTKLSIRDRSFIARTVLLDPDLLSGLPARACVHSGMDAIVQAYEAYTSRNATWFTDHYSLKAIELLAASIERFCNKPDDETRSAMLLGSYFTGVAFSHARLGVIHGLAHPLGALYNLPHGLVCAVCLPASIRLNKPAIGDRYLVLSNYFGGDFLAGVTALINRLGIENPFHGKEIIEKELIIAETLSSGSTAANPLKIGREEVELLLKEIFA